MPKKPTRPENWAKRVEKYVSYVDETNSFRRDYIDLGNLKRRGISVRDAYNDAKASY